MLDNKNKHITAEHQDERIASSTYFNYSCHFAGSMYIYFTKAGKRKIGGGGGVWGLPGTPIDMSSFYLQNEFFLFLELSPSETTLPYGVSPLAEANV